MLRTSVVTTAVGVAFVGSALAAVSTTATAAPTPDRGCQYPPEIVTTTVAQLSDGRARFGERITVRVSVRATGSNRTPNGSAVVSVDGERRSEGLNDNGVAVLRLPQLSTGNYNVRARFDPRGDCSRFRGSSDSDSLRVVKANSRARVNVGNVDRDERPKARVSVDVPNGVTARGDARVRISKGNASHSERIDLNDGNGRATFPRLSKLGKWRAVVTYFGTDNIQGDKDRDSFRVTRR